jgi:hypothetical protein
LSMLDTLFFSDKCFIGMEAVTYKKQLFADMY